MTETIEKLIEATDRVKTVERELAEARQARDELVAAARNDGVKYGDISDATGMSISWINASLLRTNGYRPRAGRPRRLQKV